MTRRQISNMNCVMYAIQWKQWVLEKPPGCAPTLGMPALCLCTNEPAAVCVYAAALDLLGPRFPSFVTRCRTRGPQVLQRVCAPNIHESWMFGAHTWTNRLIIVAFWAHLCPILKNKPFVIDWIPRSLWESDRDRSADMVLIHTKMYHQCYRSEEFRII